ncbi:MAG: hypothetical protein QW153_04235, partial [Candidatus Bilamarchaeaceae archaeon]
MIEVKGFVRSKENRRKHKTAAVADENISPPHIENIRNTEKTVRSNENRRKHKTAAGTAENRG